MDWYWLKVVYLFKAKNGCSSKDIANNGTSNDDGLKDADGILGAKQQQSHGLHLAAANDHESYTELDGLVQPKVISKTDQEIVRIIGQHLTSIGLQWVDRFFNI